MPPVIQAAGRRNQKQEVPSGKRLGVNTERLREAQNSSGSDLLGQLGFAREDLKLPNLPLTTEAEGDVTISTHHWSVNPLKGPT